MVENIGYNKNNVRLNLFSNTAQGFNLGGHNIEYFNSPMVKTIGYNKNNASTSFFQTFPELQPCGHNIEHFNSPMVKTIGYNKNTASVFILIISRKN